MITLVVILAGCLIFAVYRLYVQTVRLLSTRAAMMVIDAEKSRQQQTAELYQKDNERLHLENNQIRLTFNFPVNVPDLSRDDRIAIAAFFASPTGEALLLHLRATLCNNAISAGANKQFVAERASAAFGYSECLTQLASLSAVPTESDIAPPSQEGEAEALVNKFSP